jgi:hypothetical protein
MTTQTTQETKTEGTPVAKQEVVENQGTKAPYSSTHEAKKTEGAEAKPEKKPEAKLEAKAEAKPEGSSKKIANVTNDDDEIPDDADLVNLSPRALKSRISRATKKELKDRFGTDDPEEIQAKLAKWAELEKGEEERKRAALSEKERLEADLAAANKRAETAERQARVAAEERVVDRMDQQVGKILGKHLDLDDEDTYDIISRKLAKHLAAEYTTEELKALYDSGQMEKKLGKWAEEYAKSHPKYARAAHAAPEKKPLTNTGDSRESPVPVTKSGGENGGRNFSPSAPNAMSPREARAEAAKQGFKW